MAIAVNCWWILITLSCCRSISALSAGRENELSRLAEDDLQRARASVELKAASGESHAQRGLSPEHAEKLGSLLTAGLSATEIPFNAAERLPQKRSRTVSGHAADVLTANR